MSVPRIMFGSYQLPYVYSISDPKEGIKNAVIEGMKGDGSICVPGGKRSVEIVVRGTILGDNYSEVTDGIEALRAALNTEPNTLSMDEHWSYLVRRVESIEFDESLRNYGQRYTVRFLVLSY